MLCSEWNGKCLSSLMIDVDRGGCSPGTRDVPAFIDQMNLNVLPNRNSQFTQQMVMRLHLTSAIWGIR